MISQFSKNKDHKKDIFENETKSLCYYCCYFESKGTFIWAVYRGS